MKKRFKKILSLVLLICFIFTNVPFVLAKEDAPVPTMTPLQDLRKSQAPKEEIQEEIYEELTPEEQEILNEINNTITVSSSEESTGTIGNIQSTDVVSPLIKDEELDTMATTSTSAVTDEGFKVEPVASVYNVLNNNNDYVSQATGALTYEKNLLSLPGANGLDLNISVRYNSDDAVITHNEFAEESVHNINFNNFAVGWRFSFPTIIKSETKNNYGGWKKDTNLSFPDGSSYKITNDNEKLTEDLTLTLEEYKLSDMTLKRKADTKNYELTYTDGTVYTFDGTYGNLKQIKDRFGNEINFTYTELDYSRGSFIDYIFNPSFYKAKINVLTKIVDSAGREINIEYDIKNTSYGKEVKAIKIKMNDVIYATLNLERKSTHNGSTDVLKNITDAEGYTTNFDYDEKISHYCYTIPFTSEYEYVTNGSVMTLSEVKLPTGGHINYEYIKARRGYTQATTQNWYIVYKVSKVSDSSGFERTYEYESDRSGYPHTSTTPFYSCIMKENGKVTVSIFNSVHNKIKEQTYDEANTQNSYVIGNGQTQWTAMSNNWIYHMGYSDRQNYKTFFYKQNAITGETVILTPYHGYVYSNSYLRTCGNKLYIFFKDGQRFQSTEYDIETDAWADTYTQTFQIYTESFTDFKFNDIYYKNSKFYITYMHEDTVDCTACMAIYDTEKSVDERWSYQECLTQGGTNYHTYFMLRDGDDIYISNQNHIYKWNILTNQMERKEIGNVNIRNGFMIDNRMFYYTSDGIGEFDYENGIVNPVYTYYSSLNMRQYLTNGAMYSGLSYITARAADRNMYYIMKTKDSDGYINVYRFEPDNTEDKFVYVGSRMMENTLTGVYASGTAEKPTLLFVSDGIETMNLYEPETPQSTTVVKTTYNTYNQPISNTITRISASQRIETGTESYTYVDKKSNLLSSTDILGNKTTYVYDTTYYLPTKITQYADTDNAVVTDYTLSEDKKKTVTAVATYDDVTLKTEYTYDTVKPGNVITEKLYHMPTGATYSLAGQKDYTYVENGALVGSIKQSEIKTNNSDFTLTDAEDITVSYTYNALGQLEYETDSLGRTKAYVYTDGGLPYEDWYINGSVKEYFYEINGNRYGGENIISNKYTGYHDGEYVADYITFEYLDDMGRVIAKSEKDPNGAETVLSTYEYTGHNLTKTTDANGNYTLYDYDAFDRVTQTASYDKNYTLLNETTITYDDFNLTRTVNNSGKISKTYYDKLGRVIKEEVQTDAGLATTQTEYDYMGNVVKTTDAKGNETEYTYNDRGLLLNVSKYVTVDEDTLNDVTSYTYDALGNTLTVTNNDRVIQTNTYDTLNRVLTTTDAMGYNNKYQYDNGGRVVKSLDKKGQVTTYEYKENTDYLASQSVGNNVTSYTYDDWGNMLTAANCTEDYEYEYTYKFNNLLESVTTPDNKTITYSYDNNHNVTQVTDYTGDIINYTYNGLNKVDTISRNNTLVADYDYYNFGALQKVTYPNQGSSEFVYDNALRLVAQTNREANGSATNEYTFTYDLNGNQIVKNDSSDITTYTYDELNRLTSSTDRYGTVTQYTFDAQSNINQKIITPDPNEDFEDFEFSYTPEGQETALNNITNVKVLYDYDNNNRLTGETECITLSDESVVTVPKTYTYDFNGNLLSESITDSSSVKAYSYNELNQLTSYTDESNVTTEYTYAPDGMRRSKETNGVKTKFYWDRGYMSAESVNNTFTAKNYIGAQGVFARESGSTTEYMLKNGHGDVTNTITNGTVNQFLDYDPYGNQTMGNTSNPFRYCGEYFDEESGLIYLRNRYYDPSIGRFISEDPHWNVDNMIYGDNPVEDSPTPDISAIMQSSNLYAYCMNNPVTFSDIIGYNAIVVIDQDAVAGCGHISVIIQDDNGDWYYCYWGQNEAVYAKMSPDEVCSLENFNYALHQSNMGEAQYSGDYDHYVTIEGDFSDGLEYYLGIINRADTIYSNKKNKYYNLFLNNCSQTSTNAILCGILPNGKSFSNYLHKNKTIPVYQFQEILLAAAKCGYGYGG